MKNCYKATAIVRPEGYNTTVIEGLYFYDRHIPIAQVRQEIKEYLRRQVEGYLRKQADKASKEMTLGKISIEVRLKSFECDFIINKNQE